MDADLWNIESLRLTNFVDNEFDPKNLEKWLIDISGEQPIQINKTVSSFFGLSKLETSIVKLVWQQNRIDLIENSDAPHIANNIGHFSSFSEHCEKHILKYFQMENCPLLDRLALGVILYLPVASNEEGIKKITPLLKSVKNIKDSEDFSFRINWPIRSTIAEGIKINRLLTWTIGSVQIIQIDPQKGIAKNITSSISPELQIRLEIDLSTDQKLDRKLSLDQQKEVVNYLIKIVNIVAESGEQGLLKVD